MQKAFTLIELLIVIAIITVLSAIAVPNFLDARVRAKTSRVFADMRSYSTAIQTYRIDWNALPLDGAITLAGTSIYPTQNPSDAFNLTKFAGPPLTTPIAYMINQPVDPFAQPELRPELRWYFYTNFPQAATWFQAHMGGVPPPIQLRINTWGSWLLLASGPDKDRRDIGAAIGNDICNGYYDATNGTLSNGDILMTEKVNTIPY